MVQVEGVKRLRRSRWERGTCERVARGGVLPGPARVFHEDQMVTLVNCARLQGFSSGWLYNQERW